MAAKFPPDVTIDQGRDFFLTALYKDGTTPINITGYTAAFSLSQNYNGATTLALTTGAGITITGSAGEIDIHATATQTDVSPGTYVAELEIISPANVKTSLLKGNIVVLAKVVQ
jgi:hypothetical protein